MSWSIGELARESGVNLETIRYYERIGLMTEPPRTEGRHRVYEGPHKRRLVFIRRARDLGFTTDAIRQLLTLWETDEPCERVRALANEHLTIVRAKITHLRRLERALGKNLADCPGTGPDCPILDAL